MVGGSLAIWHKAVLEFGLTQVCSLKNKTKICIKARCLLYGGGGGGGAVTTASLNCRVHKKYNVREQAKETE